VMLPYQLRGNAKLGLEMPSAAVFEDAYLDGDKADFKMDFPLTVRVGSEIRPVPYLRMEGAFVWEQWSTQKEITVTPSEPIFLRNITGITDYEVGQLAIPRNMRDAWSVRGGFELFVPDRWQLATLKKLKVTIRGGLAYEKGAFAKNAMSPLTMDSDKIVLSAGNSFNIHKRVRMDGVIGYMFMADPQVRNSGIRQPSSIRPEPGDRTAIGNGNYKMDALYIGGGLTFKLD
jgi:long-subunit fatty acid transport protein